MKKRRLISIAVSLALVLASVSMSVMALTFSDVENDSTVSWAKDSIHKMTDAGYIKGYEDGTFKPFRAITKMECLILMSRMLGLEEEEYAGAVDNATAAYGATVKRYNTAYEKELCYLLYTGILKEADLVDYASTANANTQLLRYQAAMLMAKLMGADAEAKAYTVSTPTYADDAQIPQAAKAYVEYVTKEKVMNGMDATADGRPQFSPTTSLTRAQMATLLARMMDTLNLTCYSGTIESINERASAISINRNGSVSERKIADCTVARRDGEAIALNQLSEGDEIWAVEISQGLLLIESSEPQTKTRVYGVITNLDESAAGKKITIADYEDKTNNATYVTSSDCTFTIKGAKASYGSLNNNDFILATISGSKITAVSVEEKNLEVTGKLVSMDYDDDDHVYVNMIPNGETDEQTYVVSNKGATISRDSTNAEYRDLSAGDTLALKLNYGKVTRITAVSSAERYSGLLTEIIISSEPAVTITTDGKAKTYKLKSDAVITVAGAAGTIYDLRPNITVSGMLDSNEVKTLTAASVSINENGEMTGEVTGINTSYNVINIRDDEGNTQSVYYNSKTQFLKNNGTTATAKAIEKGATLLITGAEKNGVFEASIVIIK